MGALHVLQNRRSPPEVTMSYYPDQQMHNIKVKGKVIPLQAWFGTDGG